MSLAGPNTVKRGSLDDGLVIRIRGARSMRTSVHHYASHAIDSVPFHDSDDGSDCAAEASRGSRQVVRFAVAEQDRGMTIDVGDAEEE